MIGKDKLEPSASESGGKEEREFEEQRTEKQKQLKETQKMFQQRIQQREKDVHQLRETVESHKRSAQTAVEELIRLIRDQEKAAVSRTEGQLERLEQEINDLRRRDAELEQLSHTQDHIQFLQSFQSLSAPPESTDVNEDPFTTLFSPDGLRESVRQLTGKLEDFCKEKIPERATSTNIDPKTKNDFLQSHYPNGNHMGEPRFLAELPKWGPDKMPIWVHLSSPMWVLAESPNWAPDKMPTWVHLSSPMWVLAESPNWAPDKMPTWVHLSSPMWVLAELPRSS
ncbi:hypothetical protein Q8A67_008419 [Cirrhinus molitorella]|uniref:TRIM8/14/16/25/29/45/65 coiled-coil region domain-containing protein n=1 Tax=Cirrhinus molitorella TaxID=172907 RepID=A0AA88Q239_9TELE|nr:hypothetical protein Q8A67_008419 [Cirrhinus molitorella]